MDLNIASPEFKANPFPFYARLRAETPVYRVSVTRKQTAWLITRDDDVVDTLKDERFVKDKLNALTPEQKRKQPWVPRMFKPLERNMLDVDPPDHTRLRGLVHKAFTPKIVEQMRERIQNLTHELLETVVPRGSMDLIRDMIFLLLVAGHETTVNLIANGTLALLTHRSDGEAPRRTGLDQIGSLLSMSRASRIDTCLWPWGSLLPRSAACKNGGADRDHHTARAMSQFVFD